MISRSALEALRVWRDERRGRKPTLPLAQLLQGLLFHVLCEAGTLAEHLYQLTGRKMAESTLADRRAVLGWPMWVNYLHQALRPLARLRHHPEAFWHGLRLVAWDGTQFSLTNTPQVLAQLPKAATRRRQAAWAKLTAVVLLELGLHNPLAAAIGWHGESEFALTRQLLRALPRRSLLLADRLSGVPRLLAEILSVCQAAGGHFLIRTRRNLLVRKRRRLCDGSCRIEVGVRARPNTRKIVRILHLREIRVRVSRPGRRAEDLRLWTSLLDPRDAPALELARLYTQRWQQELYWRQMKRELRKSEVLQSHTPLTGAQEIALLVLATALLAHERARAAAGRQPVLQISFVKCLTLLRPLWLVLSLAREVLEPRTKRQLLRVFTAAIRGCHKARPRARSCLRAVRQPVSSWPRLLQPKYARGSWRYALAGNPTRR